MELRTERKSEADVPELDAARGAAWRTLLTAHAAVVERIERELAAEGVLPLGHYDVFLALYEAPDRRLRMSELARAVVLSRSGLTRLVDRLEKSGLLRRERCDDDGRGCYAALTEEGLGALRRSWPVYSRGISRHFGLYLDDEEVRVLDDALGRVLVAARG
ncbi:MAG TPA: MarR family transcriptional regulator [Rubrobacteraceae bacterium]|nr:MarR family transcriptional regulator [Rubrobacteraceae bacterium]